MVLRMESSVAMAAGRSKVAMGHGGDKAIAMNHGNEKAIAMGHGSGKRLPWIMEIKANDTDHGDGKAIVMGDRCQISDPPDATNRLGRDFISRAELLAIFHPI